jgi:hypothetical protein
LEPMNKISGYVYSNPKNTRIMLRSASGRRRQADREAADIRFSNRLHIKHNRFVPGGSKSRKLAELNFETDPHRAIGCNMQKAIEAAVDKIGDAGDLSRERKLIFARQVEEEERKELVKLLGDRGVLRVDWPGRPYGLALALGLAWSSGCRLPAAWVELWLAFNKYGQRLRKDRLLRLRLARKTASEASSPPTPGAGGRRSRGDPGRSALAIAPPPAARPGGGQTERQARRTDRLGPRRQTEAGRGDGARRGGRPVRRPAGPPARAGPNTCWVRRNSV